MFRNSASRFLPILAAGALVAGMTAAQALTTAGPNRPAPVPADYLITPFGYFHPSCVARLTEGDVVRQDERAIEHKDGSFDDMHVCAYPRYEKSGEKVEPGAAAAASSKKPAISHAWVEYSDVTTSTSYGEFYAEWTVPPAPSANDGQTVYLFPGMQDLQDVVTIIQPVLGWNADFPAAWGIASWNCCVTGTVYESAAVKVAAGDTIYGKMASTCASGTESCATWNIITQDVTSGKSTTLANTSSHGQTFNWAFAGALEVYNISQCGDYPTNGSITFHDISLYTDSLVRISNPGWTVVNASAKLTPQCTYGGSIGQQVSLTY